MTAWLYLLPEGLDKPGAQWPCLLYRPGEPARATALDALGVEPVRVVLPMELFGWLRTEPWPGRRPSTLAIAYALEEQMAGDLEALQLFVTGADPTRRYCLWFTERERFASVMGVLQGVNLLAVHIDADLLPTQIPCGLWWGGRWLLGGALPARLALSTEGLALLKERLPGDMQWLGDDACWRPTRPGLDLMAGKPHAWLFPWRSVLASAMAMGLLASVFTLARAQHIDQQAQTLSQANTERFEHLFAQQRHVVDVATRLRLAQRPRQSPQNTEMDRLAQLVTMIAASPHLEVERIAWRPGEGWAVDVSTVHPQALALLQPPLQVQPGTSAEGRSRATVVWAEDPP